MYYSYSLGGQRHPAPLSPKESIHCFQFFSHGGLLLAGAAPWHCYAATHCYADHVDIFWHRQLHNINFPWHDFSWFNLLVTLSPRRIISMYHTAQYTNCLSLHSNTSCKPEYDKICRCHHSIYPLVMWQLNIHYKWRFSNGVLMGIFQLWKVTRFRTRSQVSLEPGLAVLFSLGPGHATWIDLLHEHISVSENAAEPQNGNILVESRTYIN